MGRKSKKTAFSFPGDTPGSVDIGAALDDFHGGTSSSETVDEVIKDAKQKKQIKDAVEKIPEIFSASQVVWVFDVYVGILSFIYSMVLKTDFKAVQKELEFSVEEKTLVAQPLARVLSKYAPSEWAGMQPEIELITTMGLWTVTSYQRARRVAEKMEQEKIKADREKAVRQNPHPIRTDIRQNAEATV